MTTCLFAKNIYLDNTADMVLTVMRDKKSLSLTFEKSVSVS